LNLVFSSPPWGGLPGGRGVAGGGALFFWNVGELFFRNCTGVKRGPFWGHNTFRGWGGGSMAFFKLGGTNSVFVGFRCFCFSNWYFFLLGVGGGNTFFPLDFFWELVPTLSEVWIFLGFPLLPSWKFFLGQKFGGEPELSLVPSLKAWVGAHLFPFFFVVEGGGGDPLFFFPPGFYGIFFPLGGGGVPFWGVPFGGVLYCK